MMMDSERKNVCHRTLFMMRSIFGHFATPKIFSLYVCFMRHKDCIAAAMA